MMNKQISKLAIVAGIMSLIMTCSTAFMMRPKAENRDQRCSLTVKYKDGRAAGYVTVSTEVSGGISCIGGRDFETNDQGVVTLQWAEGCKLSKVYVKGDGYKVNYTNGNSYILTLNK
ncbi:hypothetical protein [Tannerella forsythia]|uniref:Uncharacterized protein n=1 Tax=Tannerella forsythia TaxID=28112 RepID=A0A3P1XM87_TANFO|nr:hypothetical protein [Tannerella forsythia]RRD59882.1 hypothetical protein EII40_08695 [Tannerella forsythia]